MELFPLVGFDGVVAHVGDLKGFLSITSTHDGATNTATPYSVLSIASTLAWGLGYFGMPHILLRFMAIEDTKKLKLSRRVASVWVVISMSVAVSIGIIGYAMSAEGVIPNLKDSETIIVQIAHVLSTHGIIFAINCRCYPCRYTCLNNVNFRFTASCCIFKCFRKLT